MVAAFVIDDFGLTRLFDYSRTLKAPELCGLAFGEIHIV